MNKELPKISIIVPVYNAESTIRQCLNALITIDYPEYEIIVVDDGSTDTTAQICLSYQQIVLISIPNGGPSRARNIGAQKATGQIIAFTDGDCVVHQNWLQELQKGFLEEHVAGVGGNQISPLDETMFGKNVQNTFTLLGFATSYMKTPCKKVKISHNPSCNSSYRKADFTDIGGFDESLWPGEDVDLDYRLSQNGHTLLRIPAALVSHYRPESIRSLGEMMQRYGGSAAKLYRRYGFFRPIQYIPYLMFLSFVCLVGALICLPAMAPILLTGVILIFLGLLIKNRDFKQTTIICFLSLHIIVHWHLGFCKTMLKD